jgi:ketosteroid isomerase-like protein
VKPDPILIIEASYTARREKDDAALRRLHRPDTVFTFNADPHRQGSGQRLEGMDAIFAHLARVAEHWELLEHVPGPILGSGLSYNRIIRFKMRHRASGLILEGTKRHVITILDDKIAAVEEYLDRDLIQAIQRFGSPGERPAA